MFDKKWGGKGKKKKKKKKNKNNRIIEEKGKEH